MSLTRHGTFRVAVASVDGEFDVPFKTCDARPTTGRVP